MLSITELDWDLGSKNGSRRYVDILTVEIRLLTTPFIGQFVHPLGGEGMA